MSAPKIITQQDPRPIPDPLFTWAAWEEEGEEHMIGCGRTEAEAIADLRRLWAEEGEWKDFPPDEE